MEYSVYPEVADDDNGRRQRRRTAAIGDVVFCPSTRRRIQLAVHTAPVKLRRTTTSFRRRHVVHASRRRGRSHAAGVIMRLPVRPQLVLSRRLPTGTGNGVVLRLGRRLGVEAVDGDVIFEQNSPRAAEPVGLCSDVRRGLPSLCRAVGARRPQSVARNRLIGTIFLEDGFDAGVAFRRRPVV